MLGLMAHSKFQSDLATQQWVTGGKISFGQLAIIPTISPGLFLTCLLRKLVCLLLLLLLLLVP